MKPKLLLPALLIAVQAFLPQSAPAGGVRFGVVAGFQGGWAPSRFCPPAFTDRFPRLYSCAPFAYSPWGYFPDDLGVAYSPGFRTITPLFNPPSGPVIIRVPPPILPVQPADVSPTAPFRWRR